MRYLVICKTSEGEILDWKELTREPSDNAAVMSAFDFGTRVQDTDVIYLYGSIDEHTLLICSIIL